MTHPDTDHRIERFAHLAIGAALVTITLKSTAYFLTGSVGLLSDALESVVNLVAAVAALVILRVASRPPDEEHAFGHDKAEYFSSALEGGLILLAATSISLSAFDRFFHPRAIEQVSAGLVVTAAAAIINLVVARVLLAAGRTHHSIVLDADGRHLMTDVWTSAGVIGGVALVALTGWQPLDPLVAMAVAVHIAITGIRIGVASVSGLMDAALPAPDVQRIERILRETLPEGVDHHALRTRRAGSRRFVSLHVLVPGEWTVQSGHDLVEEVEQRIRESLPRTTVLTHLEPAEDPASWQDVHLQR